MSTSNIRFPFGDPDNLALTVGATQALTIGNSLTYINGVTVPANGSNRTINLTISTEVRVGWRIVLEVASVATETTIFGTGMVGTTITGVAGKTFTLEFVYDGTSFKADGAAGQIN